ncbi:MAG: transcriptional regulator [Dictyoglomus sp. NZ13-RE01]|nr:MAG: transcriptional regulator [Dictyoglomus sp. NZ13-RE01]
MRSINIKRMREANISLVLNVIRTKGPISRYDVSKITGLSPSAVSSIVEVLLESGIIKETPAKETKVGRRPIELSMNDTNFYPIGIEIENDRVTGIVLNLRGEIIKKKVFLLDSNTEPDFVLSKVVEIYESLRNEIYPKQVMGLGVAIPGSLDRERGICLFAPNLGWQNVSVMEFLKERIKDTEIFLEHITKAATLGELWFGGGIGKENIICVRVGSGVSAGFVINGNLYRGYTDRAGEFGHTVVEKDGKKCKCGNYGCLETYVSTQVLIDKVKEGLEKGAYIKVNLEMDRREKLLDQIIQAGREGDRFILNIFEEMGEYLGIGIANLVNLLNPELVIITGGLSKAQDLLLNPVKRNLKLRAFPPIPDVITSRLREDACVVGAATCVLESKFSKIFSY